MNIDTLKKDGCLVIAVSGNLDGVSAPDFDKQTDQWINDNPKIILDCTGLEYLSSAGIRSLLNLARKAKTKTGALVLFNPGEITEKVLKLAGFANILPMYKDMNEAVENLK